MSPWSRAAARFRRLGRSSRGSAEMSIGVVGVSLLAGVLFGTGLSSTTVHLSDGLTWLADDPTGDVIQVNPATGRPEYRLDVGAREDDLEVTQYDGRMFVINHTTGQLTSFDLASILYSGRRAVPSGGDAAVLEHDGQVYLVDYAEGTIAGIDPVTTDALGKLWLSSRGLADVAIDGAGRLWTLDPHGLVTQLRWSPTSQSFIQEDTRQVDHSGPQSVIVGHEAGATVFGPDEGIVVQMGTGHDVVADAPELSGRLVAPAYSPSTLAPAASPETGSVVLVSDDQVRQVDVRVIGCEEPDRPEVLADVVYVPCPGDDRVVRLSPDGSRAAPDIATPPGSDPELVLDDGNLIINVPGEADGMLVEGDGSVHDIVRYDPDLPPTPVDSADDPPDQPTEEEIEDIADHDDGPDDPDPTPPATPTTPAPQCQDRKCDEHGTGGGTGTPSGSPSDDPGGPDDHGSLQPPTGVSAAGLPDGTVQVSWSHSGPNAEQFVIAEIGGSTLATVGGRNRQAIVSVTPGDHQFTVTATRRNESATSAASGPIATSGRPGAPTGVGGSASGSASNDTVSVSVSWGAAAANGSAVTGYSVVVTDRFGTHTLTATGTTVGYTTSCGDSEAYCDPGAITASVTARNANGDGPSAQGAVAFTGPVASPVPASGTQHVTGTTGTTADSSGYGSSSLSLSGEWASYNGTCTYQHSGNQSGQESGSIACGAGSLPIALDQGEFWAVRPGTARVTHTIVFTAHNRNGTATTATYSWVVTQPRLVDPDLGCGVGGKICP